MYSESEVAEILDNELAEQHQQMQSMMPSESGVEVEDNKIFFYCPVDQKEMLALNRAISKLGTEMQIIALKLGQPTPGTIELHIQSNGGSVFAGLSATDYILKSKVPIHTYVDGNAASAATFMSIVGARRYMHKNSFMLIHQLSSGMEGKLSEMKEEMVNFDMFMQTIRQLYKDHTKMSFEQIDALLAKDTWLDSKTCLEYGLVDEIL